MQTHQKEVKMENKIKNTLYCGLIILLTFYSTSHLYAQSEHRDEYKNFERIKIPISIYKKKLTYYIGKPKGDKVQLCILLRQKDTLLFFLNDSFYVKDSITRIDNANYDMYVSINIPDSRKKYYIYIYFVNNKKYIRVPYKRRYYFIRLYSALDEDSNSASYSNNAPSC